MQYLLSEEEYLKLTQAKAVRTEADTAKLQAFCTLAAQHIPVAEGLALDNPRPWGCILGPKKQHPGYCDDCPAKELCPHPNKRWSQ